ncbi:hypothetical protein F4778DRAFT_215944 [Xylariomycetidae sp. FL2044]|nr:hypothetical protein F4778DRAFT_215944 [Xylariomycetidae sp. FL2044]
MEGGAIIVLTNRLPSTPLGYWDRASRGRHAGGFGAVVQTLRYRVTYYSASAATETVRSRTASTTLCSPNTTLIWERHQSIDEDRVSLCVTHTHTPIHCHTHTEREREKERERERETRDPVLVQISTIGLSFYQSPPTPLRPMNQSINPLLRLEISFIFHHFYFSFVITIILSTSIYLISR